jgi:hypothetical protein
MCRWSLLVMLLTEAEVVLPLYVQSLLSIHCLLWAMVYQCCLCPHQLPWGCLADPLLLVMSPCLQAGQVQNAPMRDVMLIRCTVSMTWAQQHI